MSGALAPSPDATLGNQRGSSHGAESQKMLVEWMGKGKLGHRNPEISFSPRHFQVLKGADYLFFFSRIPLFRSVFRGLQRTWSLIHLVIS